VPEVASEGISINRSSVRLTREDVTDIEVDAFVYYAQNDLVLGSGFGTAISVRGGPTIQKELEELAPVETGMAIVSAAGNLKANHIIHAVGPKFQEEDTEGKLRATVLSALKRADEKGVRRIAFPSMGAGYYGIAPEVSARVMLDTFKEYLEGETGIQELIICLLDTPQQKAFQAQLATMA